MALNIELDSLYKADILATAQRPLLFKYDYTSGTIPKLVEVQLYGNTNGVWGKVGGSMTRGRDASSASTDPTFTFDLSSAASVNLKPSVMFDSDGTPSDWNSQAKYLMEMHNNSTNPNRNGLHKYKILANCWYENSTTGLLYPEYSDTEQDNWLEYPTSSQEFLMVADVAMSDSELSGTYSDNLNAGKSDYVISGDITGSTKNILTKCPTSLERRILDNTPFWLSFLSNKTTYNVNWVLNTFDNGNEELKPNYQTDDRGLFSTYLRADDNFILSSVSADKFDLNQGFCIYLGHSTTKAAKSHKYKFKLVDSFNKDSVSLYWINDFNVLDFFTFEGSLNIRSESSVKSYMKSKSDYTKRHESDFGIVSGVSDEVWSITSQPINRATARWLTEIGRSRGLYLYDHGTKTFTNIQVGKSKVSILDDSRSNFRVSFEFVRDSITIKQ